MKAKDLFTPEIELLLRQLKTKDRFDTAAGLLAEYDELPFDTLLDCLFWLEATGQFWPHSFANLRTALHDLDQTRRQSP